MKIPAFVTKLLNEYFRYTVTGVIVVALLLGYIFLLAPKISSLQTVQVTAQKNVENELATQKSYAADLQRSNSQFTNKLSAEKIAQINTFIPSDPDFPGLLLTVKNIVVTQGQLSLDSIAVGQGGQVNVGGTAAAAAAPSKGAAQAATVGGINLKTQDINITVSGGTSYDSFKRLLTLFESSQRIFDVVSVSYSAAATASGTGANAQAATPSWSLVLRTYYLPSR